MMEAYGDGAQWRIAKVLTANGHYWPYLLRHGIPEPLPTLWLHTAEGKRSVNTAESYLRDVLIFYRASAALGINVDFRFRSFKGFSEKELRIISSFLGRSKDGRHLRKSTCARRIEAVRGFFNFCFEHFKQFKGLSLIEQSQVDRLAKGQVRILSRYMNIEGAQGEGAIPATVLKEVDAGLILELVNAGSAENPFLGYPVRFRNYCIVRLLIETGVRRSELVLLELDDVILDSSPRVIIKKKFSATHSRRRDGASMKTVGREIPISFELAKALNEYREIWRLKLMGRVRPTVSFFVSSRDGRRLASGSVNKILEKLCDAARSKGVEERIHPHGLRATAITAIRRKITSEGRFDNIDLADALSYLGGWSQRSPMVTHYTKSAISERLALMGLNGDLGVDHAED